MRSISFEQGRIFLDELRNTYETKKKNNLPEACEKISTEYYRELLGFVHSYARVSCYHDYIMLAKRIDGKSMFSFLKKVEGKFVRAYSFLFWISKGLTYYATKALHAFV